MSGHDYERIEQAILFLEQRYQHQPSLEEIAEHLELSQSHFQRLFQRWAGISPKRFLQFLTLGYAKQRLRDSASVLNATFDAGLSSPGRLHDLFVTLDAVTPGEYKSNGHELQICYGFHQTPFGEAFIASTDRGVCGLEFVSNDERGATLTALRQRWSRATIRQDQRKTESLVEQVFGHAGATPKQPLSALVKGTNFQVRVWQALLSLPLGTVVSYGTLANHLGNERAGRAVGAAVAQNWIGYLIPCHRVIQSGGVAHRYRWGAARKRAMLGWEAARVVDSEEHQS